MGSGGEAIANVESDVIDISFTLNAEISSVNQSKIESDLEIELHCYEPQCILTLQLSGGSVYVTSHIVIPHVQGVGNDDDESLSTTAVLLAAANVLTANESQIMDVLGIFVTDVNPPVVRYNVQSMITVAPPPPSPPSPPSLPPAEENLMMVVLLVVILGLALVAAGWLLFKAKWKTPSKNTTLVTDNSLTKDSATMPLLPSTVKLLSE